LITKETFKIAVRDLVEITLKQGDLSSGYSSRTRALDGIREHTRLQSLRPDHYKREVPVSITIELAEFNLEIFGRIDGLFETRDAIMVEEIKTCRNNPVEMVKNPSPLHMAQLKCYGYMVLKEKNLETIDLLLTYGQVDSKKTAETQKTYLALELKAFFDALIFQYAATIKNQIDWNKMRNVSIKHLPFPYDDFRDSQRQLAESVYKIIKNEKILFTRAPTGTGKTIATLYPAIKSLGLNQIDKIFYLTAKTIGRTVAAKALHDLRNKGLRLKSAILTAKQKICFVSDDSCDMETCPYAQNYYGKLNAAMADLYKYEAFDQEVFEILGKKYHLCPFELSLDISLICDVIICDLNYCFDPRVSLKRYFDQNKSSFTFLIDEAHNLPDRLRSMYSAELLKTEVLKIQKLIRDRLPDMARSLSQINKRMLRMKKDCITHQSNFLEFDQLPEDFLADIKAFNVKADLWLDRNPESDLRSPILAFYFNASMFLIIAGFFASNYKFYIERRGQTDLNARLFCMDPSPVFSDLIKRSRSCVLFSATLSPIDYDQDILFTDTIDPFSIVLPSPFPKENLGVFVFSSIKTTYKERSFYYEDIAHRIKDIVATKTGNYMVYFPSYAYMNTIVEILDNNKDLSSMIVQTPYMTENMRQNFIDSFFHN